MRTNIQLKHPAPWAYMSPKIKFISSSYISYFTMMTVRVIQSRRPRLLGIACAIVRDCATVSSKPLMDMYCHFFHINKLNPVMFKCKDLFPSSNQERNMREKDHCENLSCYITVHSSQLWAARLTYSQFGRLIRGPTSRQAMNIIQ